MAATAEQIAELRRMVAEPTETTYSDTVLGDLIARNPTYDIEGKAPDEDEWVDTYDLNRTASGIWIEKSAALAANYSFSADGGSFSRSEAHAHAVKMAGMYAAKSAPKVVRQLTGLKPLSESLLIDGVLIVNGPDEVLDEYYDDDFI